MIRHHIYDPAHCDILMKRYRRSYGQLSKNRYQTAMDRRFRELHPTTRYDILMMANNDWKDGRALSIMNGPGTSEPWEWIGYELRPTPFAECVFDIIIRNS